jgi:hypothetical protein
VHGVTSVAALILGFAYMGVSLAVGHRLAQGRGEGENESSAASEMQEFLDEKYAVWIRLP